MSNNPNQDLQTFMRMPPDQRQRVLDAARMQANSIAPQQDSQQKPSHLAVAGFLFPLAAMVGLDFSGYTPGEAERHIILHLAHGCQHIFEDERADAIYQAFNLAQYAPQPQGPQLG